MDKIESLEELEALYGTPGVASLRKVARALTPEYRKWIMTSRFCTLSTVGPEGTDCSPRGDNDPVVAEKDSKTLLLPDWRGNNRLDSLRNIVIDGRISLMFMVPGSTNVVRVNGRAELSANPVDLAKFDRDGREPRVVIVIHIGEIYFQCARAILRAQIWDGTDESAGLPSPGEFLASMTDGEVGGKSYDTEWPERAAKTLW